MGAKGRNRLLQRAGFDLSRKETLVASLATN